MVSNNGLEANLRTPGLRRMALRKLVALGGRIAFGKLRDALRKLLDGLRPTINKQVDLVIIEIGQSASAHPFQGDGGFLIADDAAGEHEPVAFGAVQANVVFELP